ncbi:MAG: protein kinase domain-containing protein [Halohasta sp.]
MSYSGSDQRTAEAVLNAAITEPERFDADRLNRVIHLLESRDQTVRLSASWALGLVVSANPEAVAGSVRALASLLESEPRTVHQDIYRALGYVSTHYPRLVREAIEELDLEEAAYKKRVISAIDGYEPPGEGNVISSTGVATEYEGLGAVAPTPEKPDDGPEETTQRRGPPSEAPPTPPAIDARREVFDPVESRGAGSHVELWQVTYETREGAHSALLKQLRHNAPAAFDAEFTETLTEWQSIDDHDAIVPVIAHGTIPKPWFVVEFQEGQRLSDRIGSISRRESRWLIDRVVDAVCHAHGAGVIHGGLTPRNVIFSRTYDEALWNYPKVTNWGISRLLCQLTALPMGVPPQYAAPEQVDPDGFGGVDAATDIYHLGLIVYEVLTGRPPFVEQPGMALKKAIEETPLPPSHFNGALSEAVDTAVTKALRKSKLYRYDTVQDFQTELRQALSGGRQ